MSEPSDPPEPPALKLFLDRSVQGRRFIEAVRLLVEDVETINDRYGVKPAEQTLDEQPNAASTSSSSSGPWPPDTTSRELIYQDTIDVASIRIWLRDPVA
jgi:hypothetical protein